MADVLAGESYVRREQRPDRTRTTQRVLVVVIVLLSLVLAGELVYHLLVAPRLEIEEIRIESDLPLADEELLATAGVRIGVPYFAVDSAAVEANIERHPLVRDAQVDVTFPNRMTISASRRRPLAAALAETPDGTVPLVFDDEGVVFQIGLGEVAGELPVVSGLRFESVDLGLELPALVVEFLGQLKRIRMQSPELYRLFSEYRVVRKNEYAYEVVLYPMHYALPVRIGTSIDEDMIQYVMMMLDVLQREGRLSTLAELDFRSGEGVLRPRERVEAAMEGPDG
ncbi:MAG: cell division protein FtsQ/DivIB [Spirochaetota bacterium]